MSGWATSSRPSHQRRLSRLRPRHNHYAQIVGIVALCILVLAVVWAPWLHVKKITVSGLGELSEPAVIKAANVRTGAHFFSVMPSQVRKRLLQLPRVEEASVQLRFPSELVINISERKPVAALVLGSKYSIVDKDGRILEQVDVLKGNLVKIFGASSKEIVAPGWWETNKSKAALLYSQLIVELIPGRSFELNLDKGGDMFLVDKLSGLPIYLAEATDSENARADIVSLKAILEDINTKRIQVETIDLRVRGRPYIKLKTTNS